MSEPQPFLEKNPVHSDMTNQELQDAIDKSLAIYQSLQDDEWVGGELGKHIEALLMIQRKRAATVYLYEQKQISDIIHT